MFVRLAVVDRAVLFRWLNHLKPRPVLDRKIRQIWMVLEQSPDVHVRTVFHSLGDAIVDVSPAREPSDVPASRLFALQATIARSRAALSALDTFAASAGVGVDTAP